MSKTMLLTVGTGRNRTDIAGALSLSISRENPDAVVFLTTEKSSRETVPEFDKNALQGRNVSEHTFAEENDVELIYLHYLKILQGMIDGGLSPRDIVIDYTSGTKSMTAALFAVGLSCEVGSINYISGRRDETGRVIPGTERPIPIQPVSIVAHSKMNTARALFNLYQFEAAALILRELEREVHTPDIRQEVVRLRRIVEAYGLWDTFHLKRANDAFGKINSEGLFEGSSVRGTFQMNLQLLNRSCTKKYSEERLIDLLQNASRRVQEGKYDDALARIYRLFEFIAQIKLYRDHDKIETERISLKVLPEQVRGKYENDFSSQKKTLPFAMVRSYDLLRDLNDQLGSDFMRDYADEHNILNVLLGKRNKSVLAHGFNPIAREDCEKLMAIAETYLDKYFPGWREQKTQAEFPQL